MKEKVGEGEDNTDWPFRKGAGENGMIVLDLRGEVERQRTMGTERALLSSSFVRGRDVAAEGFKGSGRAGMEWEG